LYFLVPTTFNLLDNQREYGFPDDKLNRIHKLEIKFVATESRFPAKYDKDYHGSETESEIVKNFSNAPDGFHYVIRRRAVLILSGTIIAVTGGGRLWYHAYPADLANLTGTTDLSVDPSTTTFGFPRQFHFDLANLVSRQYKSSKPKPIPLSVDEAQVERSIQDHLTAVSTVDNSAEVIGLNMPSEDLGDDGFRY